MYGDLFSGSVNAIVMLEVVSHCSRGFYYLFFHIGHSESDDDECKSLKKQGIIKEIIGLAQFTVMFCQKKILFKR